MLYAALRREEDADKPGGKETSVAVLAGKRPMRQPAS